MGLRSENGTAGRDQRRSERLRHTVKISLTWSGGIATGFSLDISSGGIFVETSTLLPLGTEVRLRFTLISTGAPCPVEAAGHVARTITSADSDPGGTFLGMGIAFDCITRGAEALQELVGESPPQAPSATSFSAAVGGILSGGRPSDRCRAPRIPVGIPVWWGENDPPLSKGYLANVSETGAFVIDVGEVIPQGARIYLRFDIPLDGRIVEVKGLARVVRLVRGETMDLPGVGVEFEASTMDVKNLHRFIGKRLAGAKQTAELARVSDNRWSVSVGHTTAGFIFKAMAALFVGVAGLQLLFKVLNAFT